MANAEAPSPLPWHAKYSPPKNQDPAGVSASEVLEWMKSGLSAGKDFVLVDLRRNDHEGGTIRGSINLPAQSLYASIPLIYKIFVEAGVEKVAFYCSSSRGRGPRAAGWFDDHIVEQGGSMQSLVLKGGISGWVQGGHEYVTMMEEYDEAAWKK